MMKNSVTIEMLGLAVALLACGNSAVVPVATLPRADGGTTGASGGASGATGAGGGFAVLDASATTPDGPTESTVEELDCKGAAEKRGTVGCRFYATQIAATRKNSWSAWQGCFAMFVVNPGSHPVHLALSRGGVSFPVEQSTRLPRGSGQDLTYAPYDPSVGLKPGDLAVLFLSEAPDKTHGATCPRDVTTAVVESTALVSDPKELYPLPTTGIGQAFQLTTDFPVVAYQMLPFDRTIGHGVRSATLLLPVESWGLNHVTVGPKWSWHGLVLVTASEDDTEVAFQPTMATTGGGGISATARGKTAKVKLKAGEFVQFVGKESPNHGEESSLAGSVVVANKPVGVLGGADNFDDDPQHVMGSSAQQQVPPLEAMGHEYVAIRHPNLGDRDRTEPWQLVGVAAGTQLSYAPSAPPGAPTKLEAGQVVQFATDMPFVVQSQDADHPFHLSGYMTIRQDDPHGNKPSDLGGAEFVSAVSTDQYVSDYTFFTDPIFRGTGLVVVRKPDANGMFRDVKLACAPTPVTGWMPVGDFEYAFVSLVVPDVSNYTGRQLSIPGCANGTQSMTSSGPFAVTVWGWEVWNSYGYPAGAGLRRINTVAPPIIVE